MTHPSVGLFTLPNFALNQIIEYLERDDQAAFAHASKYCRNLDELASHQLTIEVSDPESLQEDITCLSELSEHERNAIRSITIEGFLELDGTDTESDPDPWVALANFLCLFPALKHLTWDCYPQISKSIFSVMKQSFPRCEICLTDFHLFGNAPEEVF